MTYSFYCEHKTLFTEILLIQRQLRRAMKLRPGSCDERGRMALRIVQRDKTDKTDNSTDADETIDPEATASAAAATAAATAAAYSVGR